MRTGARRTLFIISRVGILLAFVVLPVLRMRDRHPDWTAGKLAAFYSTAFVGALLIAGLIALACFAVWRYQDRKDRKRI